MERQNVSGGGSYDRRHWLRARISVPVHVSEGREGKGGAVSFVAAQSTNLSAGGVYLTTSEERNVVPGEILRVSIAIPEGVRRVFPFSLIEGECRVVRVDAVTTPKEAQRGFALAFCEDITRLGAIVFA